MMSVLEKLGFKGSDLDVNQLASERQNQTKDTYSFKWSKCHTYESDVVKSRHKEWLFEKYCENDQDRLRKWLCGERKIILDAGCGSGFSALLFFGDHLKHHDYLGIDISSAVDIARERFQAAGYLGDFLKMDLMDLPIQDESIDIIFSEGVLHHTDSTEKSLKFLARKLKKGGRFLFYVYAKKAVIREFTDDYIRDYLKNMTDEEAWKALESLTKLGMALGELNVELEVSEDIPFLGIHKGKIDIQRFFYWNVLKQFYNPEFSFDEMNHVNFDWFRPLNCHRHTPEEITQWCSEAGLAIEHIHVQEAGITVVSVRK
jgi:SAM-dependent methyltransferase